jgi:ABC-type Zn uptake system ZnuABC Zn-binding protein ZnuA
VAALSEAKVIILHAFQAAMKEKLLRIGGKEKDFIILPDQGSLATPPGYSLLLEQLAGLVPELLPELAAPAQAGLKAALDRVEQARTQAETIAGKRLQGRVVVVARFQKDFVMFYGLKVAAVIEPGEPSLREFHEVVEAGRAAGAVAVVGNQQSGEKSFAAVAQVLDVPLIMLSNFPEKKEGRLDYEDFLVSNVRALEQGLGH